jgi:hypothetical protein
MSIHRKLTKTYTAVCKKCGSQVFYYSALIPITFKRLGRNTERSTIPGTTEKKPEKKKVVSCTCSGESAGEKHTNTYIFPDDFTLIG